VSYAPSAALYSLCRARGLNIEGDSLVLAHSREGRLPFVLKEAEAVAEVLGTKPYLEAGATRKLIMTAGAKGVVHIAAHGQFRPDAPLFSSIELADGPLTTADVFDLDLGAPLVTLSACETGRAIVGGGDELVGLARAFLYAGASGLLVSQWRVDDDTTAALMTSFYKALVGGSNPAEALRQAQVAAIDRTMPQNRRPHPLLWAGFQFIGAN
jgi:CHAT domain-containing protein